MTQTKTYVCSANPNHFSTSTSKCNANSDDGLWICKNHGEILATEVYWEDDLMPGPITISRQQLLLITAAVSL